LKAPLPLKNLDSTKATKEAMTAFVAKIEASRDIVIGGAGPTGIEVAGEIAGKFSSKKTVHLVSLTIPYSEVSIAKSHNNSLHSFYRRLPLRQSSHPNPSPKCKKLL